ncbi:MBL fold metallo-hydrolase [Cohnella sp. GCM10012308]|uniref:MBL fold metallo-hydrolase n=1 Tax=Cohnella sp. GCM10012308 TaxID=3317329 RepID=UPI003609FE9B
MKLTVLGGGSEVGASSIHVEMNGTRLLIDAGMRMHQDDPMPSLGLLEELGGIDGILVTHAHADHIGALPVVRAMHPNVPIYATPPTIDLMRIMMQDSYRLLESRCKQEQRLMPYTEQQMQDLLASLLAFPASGKLRIGNLTVEAWRAGHILGAVMFGLTGGDERLLVTGDISFQAGRTIQGVKLPYGFQPHTVVMESTYGNRVHTDRQMEEKRLVENVAEVIAGGGFALIPAFALGRSQEILLLLQDYMERGLIPSFPIYVDGMVTSICRIYRDYPQYLKGPVAHRIRQHNDVFLTEGRCVAVKDAKQREMLLQGKPGCIVASSGMLVGGASQWYAERLIGGEKNAIFITGYQDEESPGRKLLALAEATEDRTLELNGVVHPVRCRFDKFGLSAHADAMEMTRFIEQLQPAHTLLVHGDDDARFQLSQRIDPAFGPLLVENGHSYEWSAAPSRPGGSERAALRGHRQSGLEDYVGELLLLRDEDDKLYPAICIGIHSKMRTLTCQTFRKKAIVKAGTSSVAETLGKWGGAVDELEETIPAVMAYSRPRLRELHWERLQAPAQATLPEVCAAIGADSIGHKLAAALALLALPDSHIHRVRQGERDWVLYTLDESAIAALSNLSLPVQSIRMDPATALNTVRERMSGHPRFLRCGTEGIDGAHPAIVVAFDYPDAVGADERERIAGELRELTGWTVRFSDSVRQDQMAQLARTLLGAGLAGNPSIHLQTKQLVVQCAEPPDWADIRTKFNRETGYELVLTGQAGTNGASAAGFASAAGGTEDIALPGPGSFPMEANQAQQEIKRWAEENNLTIYKASLHQTASGRLMELHFITPQVAVRYRARMAELADRIGLPISYARNPKQNEVLAVVMQRVPPAWGVKKTPSIRIDKGEVTVKTANAAAIEAEEKAAVIADIKQLTGYELIVD